MAGAQLRNPPPGLATPSHPINEIDESADIPSGVNIEDGRTSALAEGTGLHSREVVESLDSSKRVEAGASDAVSIIDHTEAETRREWSSENSEGHGQGHSGTRKRANSSGNKHTPKKARYNKYSLEHESSDSSEESSSSSSDSDSSSSDNENFNPKPEQTVSKIKVPKHVTKYIVKYATQGIDKKTRQDLTKNWPLPESKSLKGLDLDRFFKKNFFRGKKWNGKLESCKINNQLRILDAMGPLSVLWSEAERIKKSKVGMDPSDIIQLVQRAIVLIGNAHFVFNNERRRSILGKTMPDNVDLLSDKKGKKALAKCKKDLFGRKFLKYVAQETKDDKHLKELLVSENRNSKFGKGKGFGKKSNRGSNQFFQNRSATSLQFAGQRQDIPVQRGRPLQPIPGQNRQNNRFHQNQSQNQNQGKQSTM